ncbi:MAG: DNA polymerase III subunit gamma/tau [Actinobacteria bacterium]|nr:DNA polymerase III subunit gamma/tau [Actinomycetota bacterium]
MAYISLYRKWRPQTFEEVIGQEYVTRTLSNSLRNGNLAHAYLFTGPRGTGKTSTARILAKALNCDEGPTPDPCNHCRSCREITEGTSVDVVEIDAASTRGIDSIRELRERVVFSPAAARMKVYVLDEAHMLTKEAFNAFLKTLEEPPPHVVFVLATTEPHKMPATILSRCQRYDFRSVPVSMLTQHLAHVAKAEGIEANERALRLISRRARGSARDALVILEQVMNYGDGVVDEAGVAGFLGLVEDEILIELGDRLAAGDAAGAVAMVEKAYEEGRDLVQFTREVQEHFRRVFLLQYADLGSEDLEVDETAYAAIERQAAELSPDRTFHFIVSLREAWKEMQTTASIRLVLEGALIGMARSELDVSAEALSARMGKLEVELEKLARLRAGDQPAAVAPPASRADAGERESPAADTTREDAEEKQAPAIAGEEVGGRSEHAIATSSPGSAAVPLDLAAIRRAWPQVKEAVKERKVTTHAFLLEGKPLEFKAGELYIMFPADRSFHRGEMEKEDHRSVLEEALEEVLGVAIRVKTRLEENQEGGARGHADAMNTKAQRESRSGPLAGVPEESGPLHGAGEEEIADEGLQTLPETRRNAAQEPPGGRAEAADGEEGETFDTGKVKLVKDVFGAEMIEEIKLNE